MASPCHRPATTSAPDPPASSRLLSVVLHHGCAAHRTQARPLRDGLFPVCDYEAGMNTLGGPSETDRGTQRGRSKVTGGGRHPFSRPLRAPKPGPARASPAPTWKPGGRAVPPALTGSRVGRGRGLGRGLPRGPARSPHSFSAPSCPSSWQCEPPRPPWLRKASARPAAADRKREKLRSASTRREADGLGLPHGPGPRRRRRELRPLGPASRAPRASRRRYQSIAKGWNGEIALSGARSPVNLFPAPPF